MSNHEDADRHYAAETYLARRGEVLKDYPDDLVDEVVRSGDLIMFDLYNEHREDGECGGLDEFAEIANLAARLEGGE